MSFDDIVKKKAMEKKVKGTAGNQVAGQMISQAAGGNPLADGLAAGVSTGNPLVGVGMGVLSGLQGAQAEKDRKNKIDQEKYQDIAQNEQDTQMRRSAAIQKILEKP